MVEFENTKTRHKMSHSSYAAAYGIWHSRPACKLSLSRFNMNEPIHGTFLIHSARERSFFLYKKIYPWQKQNPKTTMVMKVPVSQTINYDLVRNVWDHSGYEVTSPRHNRTFLSIRWCNQTLPSKINPHHNNFWTSTNHKRENKRTNLGSRPNVLMENNFTKRNEIG